MEPTDEVMKVYVVNTDSRMDAVKTSLLTGAATVLVTQGLPWATKKLSAYVKERRANKETDETTSAEPEDPKA